MCTDRKEVHWGMRVRIDAFMISITMCSGSVSMSLGYGFGVIECNERFTACLNSWKDYYLLKLLYKNMVGRSRTFTLYWSIFSKHEYAGSDQQRRPQISQKKEQWPKELSTHQRPPWAKFNGTPAELRPKISSA